VLDGKTSAKTSILRADIDGELPALLAIRVREAAIEKRTTVSEVIRAALEQVYNGQAPALNSARLAY